MSVQFERYRSVGFYFKKKTPPLSATATIQNSSPPRRWREQAREREPETYVIAEKNPRLVRTTDPLARPVTARNVRTLVMSLVESHQVMEAVHDRLQGRLLPGPETRRADDFG